MDIEPVETSLFTKLQRHEKWSAFMISFEGILTVLLLANIIYLNIYLFNGALFPKSSKGTIQSPVVTPSPLPTMSPTACVNCLQTTITPTKTQQSQAPVIQNAVNDY